MTDTSATINSFLERILDEAHPLMAESLYMAAVPQWYSPAMLMALRQKDDLNKNMRLAERMTRYSFITTLDEAVHLYTVRPEERALLQRRWITKDPQAYRHAHQQALAFWENAEEENAFAKAQNLFYHRLFVDLPGATEELLVLFRTYRQERQLAAIERLLDTAVSNRFYLLLLNENLSELNDTISHLQGRLSQLRGRWSESLDSLETLRQKPDLSPRLRPLVSRAYGHALANTGQFVEAIDAYQQSLNQFAQLDKPMTAFGSAEAEKAYTLIAVGDAHVGLAMASRGFEEQTAVSARWGQRLSNLFYFFISLPLLIYLSRALGRSVWRPRFWPALRSQDWMIARLFALGARAYKEADPILEKYGKPAEGVAADERLANLYLAVGDVERAQETFAWLLEQADSPLGDYHQAVVQVGLGEALLRLGQANEAREALEMAVNTLTLFEDPDLLALAQALLAGARQNTDPAQATAAYRQAQNLYQQQNRLNEATNVNERLHTLAHDPSLPESVREAAAAAAAELPTRQYRARYRHRITVVFQRVVVMLLALALFLIPISVIRLETGSAVEPDITFNATPLLQQNNPNFVPDLSQGISALNLAEPPNPDVLVWLGVTLFALYLLFTTALGLWSIARTPLRDVQAAGEAEAVRLDDNGLTVGGRPVSWQAVSGIVRADVRVLQERLVDNAVTAVLIPNQPPLRIRGSMAWYEAIQHRVEEKIPATARRTDLGYSMLRSGLGLWYGLTLLALLALSLMGRFLPQTVLADFLGPYSLADIYPYLYLGLFVPPLWWFALRPLTIARRTDPRSRLPLWLAGASGVLALLRLATLFRPWFTVPDIYPSLAILLLAGAGSLVIWRGWDAGAAVFGQRVRMGTAVFALAAVILMGTHVLREVVAYHYLVVGNTRRDAALELPGSPEKDALVADAITAYTQAMSTAQLPFPGIGQAGLRIPVGIPRTLDTTWMAAANSRAAMYAQLGQYAAAVHDYTRVLAYTQDPVVYVSRAIAYLGLGTQPGAEVGMVDVEAEDYGEAIADFNEAIARAPGEARYVLWRGVAYHALSDRTSALAQQAQKDYEDALAITGANALEAQGKAQSWIGQGWLSYQIKDYETAVDYFQRAVDNARQIPADAEQLSAENKTAVEALLGLGYTYYSLRQYDEALEAWNEAADLNDRLPQPEAAVPISLGTLYWRVATLGDDYDAFGVDRCQLAGLAEAEKAVEAENLEASLAAFDRSLNIPGQDDAGRAFTFRTMGQVTYLLRDCPGYDKEQVLKDAHGEYVDAVALAPGEAGYWYRKGRLAYAVWVLPGVENSWLETAVSDMGGAIAAAPDTALYWHDRAWMSYLVWQYAPSDAGVSARRSLFAGLADLKQALALDATDRGSSYRPNYWEEIIYDEAVNGTLRRGDGWFANGEYATALDYYVLVAENVPENAVAALKAGVAAAALDDRETAVFWYDAALERAGENNDPGLEGLIDTLQELLDEGASLDRTLAQVTGTAVDPVPPPDAETFFARALLAVQEENYTQAAQLYQGGLLLVASGGERDAALNAAYALRDWVLANGDVGVTAVYWPALLDEKEVETAVSALDTPDLYWRYRADFGFQLINRPFRQQVGSDEDYAAIFPTITSDIRRAYALDAAAHQVWYDFYVDANLGWLYLRRADDLVEAGRYEDAIPNYAQAINRIQPNSVNARGDLADAIFNGALTALRLEQADRAARWYAQGIALTRRYAGLEGKRSAAAAALAALLADYPDLAVIGEPILGDLSPEN